MQIQKTEKGLLYRKPLSFVSRGDVTRTHDPPALRDTLANIAFIIIQES